MRPFLSCGGPLGRARWTREAPAVPLALAAKRSETGGELFIREAFMAEDLGSDFGGALDIDQNLSESKGTRALLECVARRWYDRAGSLFYDKNYGVGIETYLNAVVKTSDLATILEEEALKDERVDACTVVVTTTGESLTIDGRIETADGPYELTVVASSLDVTVLLQDAA